MARLLHAMGDVHPHALKAQLARELSRLTFERWTRVSRNKAYGLRITRHATRNTQNASPLHAKTIFCNSGFEAVEAALKTALLATGKRGVIAFQGAYHGTGYGALDVTHRDLFRAPFLKQLGAFAHFVEFPRRPAQVATLAESLGRLFRRREIGAILVEPVQGRAGIVVPPPRFLPLLRRCCDGQSALLIADEIYTGFGRTGRWFACEHTRTIPDLMCLGKALTGGFPLSACVGRADLMDAAWPESTGEATHTSTFLGHPVGCAMALAQIREIQRQQLVNRSARLGRLLLALLKKRLTPPASRLTVRGLGLMVGVELCQPTGAPATDAVFRALKAMLRLGYILLPEGEHANVISVTPPLTITERQLRSLVDALAPVLRRL
jgi:4-aminobutyrate aminotransferase-like enzyme